MYATGAKKAKTVTAVAKRITKATILVRSRSGHSAKISCGGRGIFACCLSGEIAVREGKKHWPLLVNLGFLSVSRRERREKQTAGGVLILLIGKGIVTREKVREEAWVFASI